MSPEEFMSTTEKYLRKKKAEENYCISEGTGGYYSSKKASVCKNETSEKIYLW